MDSMETLRSFLGWCSAINIGLLCVTALILVPLRGPISKLHAGMYGLNETDLSRAYFQYLAQYKIAIIVFNLVPYIALRVMA